MTQTGWVNGWVSQSVFCLYSAVVTTRAHGQEKQNYHAKAFKSKDKTPCRQRHCWNLVPQVHGWHIGWYTKNEYPTLILV